MSCLKLYCLSPIPLFLDHNTPSLPTSVSGLRRESSELFVTEKIPSLLLMLSFSTQITTGIKCLMAAEEEIVIGTKNGEICGVHWDGNIDDSFIWKLTSKTFSATDDINVV
ncbi:unnamed protein product, partial [Oppiella nova]